MGNVPPSTVFQSINSPSSSLSNSLLQKTSPKGFSGWLRCLIHCHRPLRQPRRPLPRARVAALWKRLPHGHLGPASASPRLGWYLHSEHQSGLVSRWACTCLYDLSSTEVQKGGRSAVRMLRLRRVSRSSPLMRGSVVAAAGYGGALFFGRMWRGGSRCSPHSTTSADPSLAAESSKFTEVGSLTKGQATHGYNAFTAHEKDTRKPTAG